MLFTATQDYKFSFWFFPSLPHVAVWKMCACGFPSCSHWVLWWPQWLSLNVGFGTWASSEGSEVLNHKCTSDLLMGAHMSQNSRSSATQKSGKLNSRQKIILPVTWCSCLQTAAWVEAQFLMNSKEASTRYSTDNNDNVPLWTAPVLSEDGTLVATC